MKSVLRIAAFLCFFAVSLSADTLETVYFRSNLSPANEVPPVTGVTASGKATVAFHLRRDDAGTIVSGIVDFDVDYNFADAVTITGLHIHEAAAGVNGPIRIESGITPTATVDAQGTGNIFRQTNVDSGAALTALAGVMANPANYYVNLHTSVNPGGLIRDQLTRMELLVVRAESSPANEVPPIAELNASGTGSAFILAVRNAAGMITEGTVRYDVTYSFPGEVTIQGLHIHPGVAGTNGPARLNTPLSATNNVVDADGSGTLNFKVEVNSTDANNLAALRTVFANPANAYMNLHTSVNPGGAIRGQLMPTTETSIQFPMASQQEVPPAQPEASGIAKVSVFAARDANGQVTSATVLFDVNFSFPGTITLQGFHIHDGAAGINGPVRIDSGITGTNTVVDTDGAGNLFKLMDVNSTTRNGQSLPAVRTVLTTPENHYLNLHSSVNPGGHIRGQLVSGAPPAPAISNNGIVNATFGTGVAAASPGSLISIFGANQARATAGGIVAGGRLGTSVSGTEVRIGGVLSPLLYVSPTQINAQVPYEVAAGTQPITVTSPGGTSGAQNLTVSAVSPGIFAVVKNSDFSLTTPTNPARAGDALAIFLTGLGAALPAVQSGQLGPLNPFSTTTATSTVTIGGVNATVAASVLAPGFVGVDQVNVFVPATAPTGTQPVRLTIGGVQSNIVNITIQ